MNAIYAWGLQVATTAVVIALSERLLPDSSIKRYAKVGLGLLLVSAMLFPLKSLLQ